MNFYFQLREMNTDLFFFLITVTNTVAQIFFLELWRLLIFPDVSEI